MLLVSSYHRTLLPQYALLLYYYKSLILWFGLINRIIRIRYFPLEHKSYKSHDNLLLCGSCHLVTTLNEDILKAQIASEYDSPIATGASKQYSDPVLFRVKNAARSVIDWYLFNTFYQLCLYDRALAQSKNPLPEERAEEYREVIMEFYQVEELSEDLIHAATKIDPK